jgi:hypothetical protein
MTYANPLCKFVSLFTGRLLLFIAGWAMSTQYADWRQVVGYPLLLVGSLPDSLLVRYVCSPRSSYWVWVMVGSLGGSSILFVRLYALFRGRSRAMKGSRVRAS